MFFAYIAAFLGYMFIRITKTLALGNYFVYGLFVLGVEILGATTTIIYGAPCNHQDAVRVFWRQAPSRGSASVLLVAPELPTLPQSGPVQLFRAASEKDSQLLLQLTNGLKTLDWLQAPTCCSGR